MRLAPLLLAAAALAGCATQPVPASKIAPRPPLTMETLLRKADLPDDARRKCTATSPTSTQAEPDLRKRIAAIGAPEHRPAVHAATCWASIPFELHDSLPMFSLENSDCVVFAEHTYAMALSQSWEEFFWMLQRIRYKDGVIGVATRNHYTEVDWNINNSWLVTDISAELAGAGGPSYPADGGPRAAS